MIIIKGKITVESSIIVPIVLSVIFIFMYIIILSLNEVIIKSTVYSQLHTFKCNIEFYEEKEEKEIFEELNKKVNENSIIKFNKCDYMINDNVLYINYYYKIPVISIFKDIRYYSVKVRWLL